MFFTIYRVLKFEKSDRLRQCISFNTGKRKKAVNSFEKDLFKLMHNSVYGKTMENLRKRVKTRLINNAKDYKNWVSR